MFHLCATFPKVRKCLPGASPLLESPFPALSSEKKKRLCHTPIPKPDGLDLMKTQLSGPDNCFPWSEPSQSPSFSQEIEERWQPVLTIVGQKPCDHAMCVLWHQTEFLILPTSTFLDTWAALVMMVGQFSFNEDRLGQCRLFFKEYKKNVNKCWFIKIWISSFYICMLLQYMLG